MRPSQNLPLPPRIYPFFQQLYATIPESTSPSQNIPPFQQLYATLPESTPPSQNIPPFQPIYMCDPPRIYPSLPESSRSPFSTTISDLPRIYPSLSEYTPILQLYATLPESTPPSRNILPFFNNYNSMRPSQKSTPPSKNYPPPPFQQL